MVRKPPKGTETYDGALLVAPPLLPKFTFYFVHSSFFTVWEAFVLTPHTFSGDAEGASEGFGTWRGGN